MKLKSLNIRAAESYDNWKGYRGVMEVSNPSGEVKLNLSDESCRKVLELLAGGVAEAAAQTASFLRSEAASLMLEAPNV